MIYLIDDKKERQLKFGWNNELFEKFKNLILPIWTYNDMKDIGFRKQMFSDNNIIFIHESFFNIEINQQSNKDIVDFRENLENKVKEFQNLKIIYFSGSINSTIINDNIGYISVSKLYKNLLTFVTNCVNANSNLDYLFHGKNPNIERELGQKMTLANNEIEKIENLNFTSNNLCFKTAKSPLTTYSFNFKEKNLFNKTEDEDLNEKILEDLKNEEFDNIFIPLCFGVTLSDYNGLRFATLIRCTKTTNQLKPIFIYSFVGYENIINDEYFNILKTKNIFLIDYKTIAFKEALEKKLEELTFDELPKEIGKLKLEVPDDYEDNHSIANEYGLYQLAYNANIDIEEIPDFNNEKMNSIYFKWLICKNGLYEELPTEIIEENNFFRAEIKKPKLTFTGKKIDLSKFNK